VGPRQLAMTGVLGTGSRSTTCRPTANVYSVVKAVPLLPFDLFRVACGCWNCTAMQLAGALPEATAGEALLPDPSRCRRNPQVASPSSSAQAYQECSAGFERSQLHLTRLAPSIRPSCCSPRTSYPSCIASALTGSALFKSSENTGSSAVLVGGNVPAKTARKPIKTG
jgi:hypothetical protein